MKKRVAMLTAAAMVSSISVSAIADDATYEDVMKLAMEMQTVENAAITEEMTMEIAGQKITMTAETDVCDGAVGGVDITVGRTFEGIDMSVTLNDIVRVLPDAVYVNIGGIADQVSEMAGEDMSEYLTALGITEQWLAIYAADMPVFPEEPATALCESMMEYLYGATAGIPVTAIDGGYQYEMTMESAMQMSLDMILGLENYIASWVDQGVALLAGTDVQPFIDSYVVSIVDAIAAADESFDRDSVMEMVNSIPAMLPELSEMINSDMVMEMLAEEGLDFESMKEELEGLDLSELMGEEDMPVMNMTGSIQKLADGSYVSSTAMSMEVEGETMSETVKMTVVPGAAEAVSAPESSQDLKNVLATVIEENYGMIELLLSDMGGDDGDDWDDGDDDGDEPTLEVEGNRFKMEDSWSGLSCYVTFDESKMSLDMEFSDPDYVFLDLVEYDYEYISIGIGEGSFEDNFAEDAEWYSDPEYYSNCTVSELATYTEGLTPVTYGTIEYTSDDSTYKSVYFGIALPDGNCITGDYLLGDYSLTAEQVVEVIANGILTVE